MAIIPKVGSGGEKFDITNGIRKQYVAANADIEKHTFVEMIEMEAENSLLTSIDNRGLPEVLYEDGDITLIYNTYDLPHSICALIKNGDTITASNWVSTTSDISARLYFLGKLDANRWLISYGPRMMVLKLTGQTLTLGTAVQAIASDVSNPVIYLISSNLAIAFDVDMEGYSGSYNSHYYIYAAPYIINNMTITKGTDATIFEESTQAHYEPEVLYTYPTENNSGIVVVNNYDGDYKTAIPISISGKTITVGTGLTMKYNIGSIESYSKLDNNSFIYHSDLGDEVCGTIISNNGTLYKSTINSNDYPYYFYNVSDGVTLYLQSVGTDELWAYLIAKTSDTRAELSIGISLTTYADIICDVVTYLGNNRYRIFYSSNSRCGACDITINFAGDIYNPGLSLIEVVINSGLIHSVYFVGLIDNLGALYAAPGSSYNKMVYIKPIENDLVLFEISYAETPESSYKTCLVYNKNCIWSIWADSNYHILAVTVNSEETKYSDSFPSINQDGSPNVLLANGTTDGIQFVSGEDILMAGIEIYDIKIISDDEGNVAIPGIGVQTSVTKIEGVTEEKIFEKQFGNVIVLNSTT